MSCGVGRRCGSDLALLWPWDRLAAAALIEPLAWELPNAAGVALKRKKKEICALSMKKILKKKKLPQELANDLWIRHAAPIPLCYS